MKKHLLAVTTALTILLPNVSHAQDVTARLKALEQEIAILKRQQEVKEEVEKTKSSKAATVEIGKKGFSITSPDKNYQFRFRGNAQIDGRYFANDENNTGKDEFLARRLRPMIEGTIDDFDFKLMPDFAGGQLRLLEAYVDYKASDAIKLRFGKFKPPIGLERLQSQTNLLFIERGLANNLAPSRDFGIQLHGNLIPQTLEYQIGVFNGGADLAADDSDVDDKKDIAARIFANPFSQSDSVALRGLGIGVGSSIGDREGDATSTILGDYRSGGQQRMFRYTSGAFANGTHLRVYPQANYYYGPFGSMAEYAISNQEVEKAGSRAKLQHKAWNVSASYVLTGEDASFSGVIPAENFSLEEGGIGAWEIATRLGNIEFDKDSFPIFASATDSVREATAAGFGVNWYLNPNVKWQANYEITKFDGGAAGGQDRPKEHAIFTRVQYQF